MKDFQNIKNSNAYTKSLRRFFSVKTILLLIAAVVFFRMIYWNLGYKETYASDLSFENIIQAINNERTLRNLSTLKEDSRLSSAAQYKASDMQTRHYFSHTDPEGNYIWPKIVAAGYTPYLQLGENLAIEFYNTESLVAAWMNSPTHKANILNEGFKDQGMGLEFGNSSAGQYHSAITNTFGTLAGKKVSAQKPVETKPNIQTPPTTKPQTLPATTPTTPAPPVPVIPPPAETAPTATPKSLFQIPTSTNSPSLPLITIEQKPGFSTPQHNPPESTTSASSTLKTLEASSKKILQSEESSEKYNINIKRYLSITLAILLIMFVISDIKETVEQKLQGIDKKINNLILLVLALIVIAFLYWL